MVSLCKAACSEATWYNKDKQFRLYYDYMLAHKASPYNPDAYDIASYISFLQTRFTAPATIANYLCGAKTMLVTLCLNVVVFAAPLVLLVKRGLSRFSTHTSHRAISLTVHNLRTCITYFNCGGRDGLVLSAALLCAFFSLLRQSNLFTTSHGSKHLLRASDVTVSETSLILQINSTKTLQKVGDAFLINLPALPDKLVCPVTAWVAYTNAFTLLPLGPAFVTPTGQALAADTLIKAIRQALAMDGYVGSQLVTLHSIRRGAAQAAALAGSPLADIMTAETWKSASVHDYVPKNLIQPPPALLSVFGGGQRTTKFSTIRST